MSRSLGVFLLLIASVALGVVIGELNFRFFEAAVPPVAMGQMSLTWVHTMCLVYGAGLGVVFFAWGLLASTLSRAFRGRRKKVA